VADAGKKNTIFVKPEKPLHEMSEAELREVGGALFDALNEDAPAASQRRAS